MSNCLKLYFSTLQSFFDLFFTFLWAKLILTFFDIVVSSRIIDIKQTNYVIYYTKELFIIFLCLLNTNLTFMYVININCWWGEDNFLNIPLRKREHHVLFRCQQMVSNTHFKQWVFLNISLFVLSKLKRNWIHIAKDNI